MLTHSLPQDIRQFREFSLSLRLGSIPDRKCLDRLKGELRFEGERLPAVAIRADCVPLQLGSQEVNTVVQIGRTLDNRP